MHGESHRTSALGGKTAGHCLKVEAPHFVARMYSTHCNAHKYIFAVEKHVDSKTTALLINQSIISYNGQVNHDLLQKVQCLLNKRIAKTEKFSCS